MSDPIEILIKKFENHQTFLAVIPNIPKDQIINFSDTDLRDIFKESTTLNNKKGGTFGNIRIKCLNKWSDTCTLPLNNI